MAASRPIARSAVALLLAIAAVVAVAFADDPSGDASATTPTTAPAPAPRPPATTQPDAQDAAGPTSQPDRDVPDLLPPGHLAALKKIADRLNQFRWDTPIIETFQTPPDPSPWTSSTNTPINFVDGRMHIAHDDPGKPFCVSRPLPSKLDHSEGIRIEALIEPENVLGFPQLGVFLTRGPGHPYRWDYWFLYAYSQEGRYQQLTVLGHSSRQHAFGSVIQPNQQLHVVLELVGARVTGWRDKDRPVETILPTMQSLADPLAFGLSGRTAGVRVKQVTFRGLVPTISDEESKALWVEAPFADQAAFDEFLTTRVIPLLNDPFWARRAKATDLLIALMPLSRPAIRKAAQTAGPEARLRLEFIDHTPRPIVIEPLPAPAATTSQPDDAQAGPTSRPDEAQPNGPPAPARVRVIPVAPVNVQPVPVPARVAKQVDAGP